MQHGTLLLHELGNHVALHLTGRENYLGSCGDKTFQLNERELNGIGYIAGYVFHKVFTKLRKSKDYHQNQNHQLCALLLKSAKVDVYHEKQWLISARTRGGLWALHSDAENIFVEAEFVFRNTTVGFTNQINYELVIDELMGNSILCGYFQNIYEMSEMSIDKEVLENILETLLGLFVHVRAHSFAKDIREHKKVEEKKIRKRALRTEIKKSSNSTDQGY